jgi:5-methylcytosine-specific restriction enzyme A
MLLPRVATLDTRVGQSRPGARARGYDTGWSKASDAFKAAHRFCLGCAALGIRAPTEVVDHVVPHRGDRALFWDSRNWQPACTWHHSSVKASLEAKFDRGEISAASLWLDSAAAIELGRKSTKG